jgi:alkanesulfonate monooxygenase SsuD/methylene tetrahydromethanopterin reductase-like flavin-dependent oxidoreductase (luciferase family)
VGGHGAKRTPRLAAKFADEFNVAFSSYEVSKKQFDLVDEACRTIGRDPTSLLRSVAQVVCCGATDAEVARRAANIGREVDELKANGIAGTPGEVIEKIQMWGELGLSRLYLQVLDMKDLDHVHLIASDVMPSVR